MGIRNRMRWDVLSSPRNPAELCATPTPTPSLTRRLSLVQAQPVTQSR